MELRVFTGSAALSRRPQLIPKLSTLTIGQGLLNFDMDIPILHRIWWLIFYYRLKPTPQIMKNKVVSERGYPMDIII